MYTISKKLKTTALILMTLGLVGIVYGFLTAPKTLEEVEAIIAASHHEGHNAETVKEDAKAVAMPAAKASHAEATHEEAVATKDTTAVAHDTLVAAVDTAKTEEVAVEKAAIHHESAEELAKEKEEHAEHVLHQLQNKPWAALYVACIFFMLVSLGVLAFYAIQQVLILL